MSNWPNLFIAGAPRCGTSSLDAYFQAVPGIYMCRIERAEFLLARRDCGRPSNGESDPRRAAIPRLVRCGG